MPTPMLSPSLAKSIQARPYLWHVAISYQAIVGLGRVKGGDAAVIPGGQMPLVTRGMIGPWTTVAIGTTASHDPAEPVAGRTLRDRHPAPGRASK
jgi:hypothetical protein